MVGKALSDKATSTEKWYGTCYEMEDVEAEQLERWRTAGNNELLQLPKKNEFVPSCFDLFKDAQASLRFSTNDINYAQKALCYTALSELYVKIALGIHTVKLELCMCRK